MRALVYLNVVPVLACLAGLSCGRFGVEQVELTAKDAGVDIRTPSDQDGSEPEPASDGPAGAETGAQVGAPPCAMPVAIVDIQPNFYCGPCNTNFDSRSASVVLPAGTFLVMPMSGAFSTAHGRDGTWVWRLCGGFGEPREVLTFHESNMTFASEKGAFADAHSAKNILDVAHDNTRVYFWARDAICSDNVGLLRIAICPRSP